MCLGRRVPWPAWQGPDDCWKPFGIGFPLSSSICPRAESVFGLAVAECLDGVLLVLEAERMRVQVVERAKQLFAQSRVNLLGAVLNKRRMHIPGWLYRRL